MKTIMGKSALMAGILALTIAIPAANAASDKTDKAEIYRLLELFLRRELFNLEDYVEVERHRYLRT